MEKLKATDLTKRQVLNNHIVRMRKCVRQAKVHVINKLTKEVRKLKNRKGDENQIKKSQRKVARLLAEIDIIKHLKNDKVSIIALPNKSTLDEVVQSLNETTENRAIARLIHHPSVQVLVLSYREQNPLWELQIPVLLEKSVAKEKKKAKKLSSSDQPKLKTLSEEEEVPDKHLKPDISSDSEHNVDDDNSESESESLPLPNSKKSTNNNIIKSKKITTESPKLDQIKGTIKIQQLNEDLSGFATDTDLNLGTVSSLTNDHNQVGQESKRRPKSSFFLGGVDTVEPEIEKRGPPEPFKPAFRANDRERHQKQPVFRKGKLINNINPRERTPRYFDKPTKPIAFNSKPSRPGPDREANNSGGPTTEKLHPSWEAKKRLQQSTFSIPFQGKKTRFD